MLELTDEELGLVVKSLSISYDSFSRRLERVTGNRYTETLDEVELCDQTLTKAKQEQMRRLRASKRVMPIGTPSDDDWNRK